MKQINQTCAGENELIIPARIDNLERVQAFVAEQIGENCLPKTQMQIDLAVEEIFVNIASYAYAPGEGSAAIQAAYTPAPPTATVVFRDCGRPFDPLAMQIPDLSPQAAERRVGGLGIFLTRQLMDEVRYEYRDGQNILTLQKKL